MDKALNLVRDFEERFPSIRKPAHSSSPIHVTSFIEHVSKKLSEKMRGKSKYLIEGMSIDYFTYKGHILRNVKKLLREDMLATFGTSFVLNNIGKAQFLINKTKNRIVILIELVDNNTVIFLSSSNNINYNGLIIEFEETGDVLDTRINTIKTRARKRKVEKVVREEFDIMIDNHVLNIGEHIETPNIRGIGNRKYIGPICIVKDELWEECEKGLELMDSTARVFSIPVNSGEIVIGSSQDDWIIVYNHNINPKKQIFEQHVCLHYTTDGLAYDSYAVRSAILHLTVKSDTM